MIFQFSKYISSNTGSLLTFRFIITWTKTDRSLSYIRGVSKKAQGRLLDLYDVIKQVCFTACAYKKTDASYIPIC